MSWNNRIMRHKHRKKGTVTYAVHEVYYNKKGKPDGWTKNPMTGHFETVDELLANLKQMLNDCERSKGDILDYK